MNLIANSILYDFDLLKVYLNPLVFHDNTFYDAS